MLQALGRTMVTPQWEIVHKQINYRQVKTNSSFDLIYKLRCAALNSSNVRFSTFQDFFFLVHSLQDLRSP